MAGATGGEHVQVDGRTVVVAEGGAVADGPRRFTVLVQGHAVGLIGGHADGEGNQVALERGQVELAALRGLGGVQVRVRGAGDRLLRLVVALTGGEAAHDLYVDRHARRRGGDDAVRGTGEVGLAVGAGGHPAIAVDGVDQEAFEAYRAHRVLPGRG